MQRSVFSLICFFLVVTAAGAGEWQDSYGNLADYLDSIYGIDRNAGLTAFPVLNIPVGGRSGGMASSFSAVCDDISFLEYNPAGSAWLSRSELAFFHNNWIADTKLESAAYATRIGNLGIATGGKWLYTPFTEYNIYGERVSNGYYSEGLVILNASYNFLAGYNFAGLSAGISLKGVFRIMPDYTGQYGELIENSGWSQSAFMAMADIGLLTRFNFLKFYTSRDKNTSASITLRNLGPPSMGEALPTVFNMGLSYRPFRPVLISADFFVPVNFVDLSYSERIYGSFGASVNVTSFLSMYAGFMLKAGSSRLAIGSAIELNKISIDINYTLDLLTQLQPMNRVSIAFRLDLGDSGRKRTADRVDELYLSGLDAYSNGNYALARSLWEQAVAINPRFDPALEALAILKRRESIVDRANAMGTLDF